MSATISDRPRPLRRFLVMTLRLVALVIVLLAIGAGTLLWRLDRGPLSLAWLQPHIERALTPDDGVVSVLIGQTQLRLDPGSRAVELVGLDVRYRASASGAVVVFPEVEITLSLDALFRHRLLAAAAIAARAPSLTLTRTATGIVGLSSVSPESGGEEGGELDLGAFLHHFATATPEDGRIGYLQRLRITGGRLRYYDRTLGRSAAAEAADLILVRDGTGVRGRLEARLLQTSGSADLQLLGRFDRAEERLHLVAEVDGLVPADLAPLLPEKAPALRPYAAGAKLPLDLQLRGSVGLDGSLSPLAFELSAEAGSIEQPEFLAAPVPVESFSSEGRIIPDLDRVVIDRMRLVSGDVVWQVQGEVGRGGEHPEIALDLVASGIGAGDLERFWPPAFGRQSRVWVLANVAAGRIETAEVKIRLAAEEGEPPDPERIQGRFDVTGVELRYHPDLPPLVDGRAAARFEAGSIAFELAGGRTGGLEIARGDVRITGGSAAGGGARLALDAGLGGPLPALLALLDRLPRHLPSELGIDPDQASGEAELDLVLGLPLGGAAGAGEVELEAEARLSAAGLASWPRFGPDIEVADGDLTIAVDQESAKVDGRFAVNGVPLTIAIEEPLAEDSRKVKRYKLQGEIDEAGFRRLGLAGEDGRIDRLAGSARFEATISETEDQLWLDLDVDLEPLAFALPAVAWSKQAGEAGRLRAAVAIPETGPLEGRYVELIGDGLRAEGSFEIARPSLALADLHLTSVELGDSRAAVRLRPQQPAEGGLGLDLLIDAERLDLDRLLPKADSADRTAWDDDAAAGGGMPIRLVLRADEVLADGLRLQRLEADAQRDASGWRMILAEGDLAAGGRLTVELVEEDGGQRFKLRSDDAGALLRALKLGDSIGGGRLRIDADIAAQKPRIEASGRVRMDDFTLYDVPLLGRLLTVASFTGIGNLLGGEGIGMEKLRLPFTLKDRVVEIERGRMSGSQLGLSFNGVIDLEAEQLDLEGTIVPVYTLNRIIAQVPIVGRILTGKDGLGAFAATYQIKGPQQSPQIFVNPLSILAPGLIRDIFNSILESEPPEIPDEPPGG